MTVSAVEHYKAVTEELALIFATRTRDECEAKLQAHDVVRPCARPNTANAASRMSCQATPY